MPTDKIEKFKSLLKLVDESISRADFELAFKSLIDFVKKLKTDLTDKNSKTVEELRTLINQLAKKLEDLNQESLGEAQTKINQALKEQEVGMNFIRDKIRKIKEGKDGAPGVSPDPHTVALEASKLTLQAIKPEIPTISQLNENLSKQGLIIRDALEGLPEEEKTEIEAVKDLRKELDELRQLKGTRTFGGGGFSRSAMEQYFVDGEVPVAVPNGVITDFLLLYTPSPASSLQVFKDGQLMKLTTDYTFSGLTVSFVDAPLTDSLILFYYRR